MTISQYLGQGSTSKGRLTITSGLTMTVSDPPYLKTQADIDAVVQGIKNLQAALAGNSDIEVVYPSSNQTVEDFLSAVSAQGAISQWPGADIVIVPRDCL